MLRVVEDTWELEDNVRGERGSQGGGEPREVELYPGEEGRLVQIRRVKEEPGGEAIELH